jgi:hypothetical protein
VACGFVHGEYRMGMSSLTLVCEYRRSRCLSFPLAELAHPEFISLQQVLEAVTVLQYHFMGRPELGTTVQEQQQQKQNIDRSQSSTTPEQQLLLQKLLIHTCHLLEQENNVATTLTPQTPLRDATTMPPSPPQPLNRVPLLRSIRLLLLQCIDSTWSPNALLTLSIDQTAPTNMPDYKSSSSSTDVQSDDLSGASEHPNK